MRERKEKEDEGEEGWRNYSSFHTHIHYYMNAEMKRRGIESLFCCGQEVVKQGARRTLRVKLTALSFNHMF